MNILIISINHRFQLIKGVVASEWDRLRDHLASLLLHEIEMRHSTFIGEEAAPNPNRPTIAQRLAGAHSPPIFWQNIDMTESERKLAGIYDALMNRPYHPQWRGSQAVMIEHRIPEDNVREEFMVSKAIECSGEAESILVICGDMHSRALKQKFERLGHRVAANEDLITEKNWADVTDR